MKSDAQTSDKRQRIQEREGEGVIQDTKVAAATVAAEEQEGRVE